MLALQQSLIEIAKKIAFRYTKIGAPRYSYNIEPIQLATLVMELQRLKNFDGNVVEIGVARGLTTRFLAQHILSEKLDQKLTYYAIDTFESFKRDDLNWEVEMRGKSLNELKGFEYNDHEVWKNNFSEFPFVKTIKEDCSVCDYNKIGPIKLTLLDVDLYLPTKRALPRIYDATIEGGTILVDDVLNNSTYDGSYQAYIEFCEERNFPPKIIGNKCGVIQKI